MKTNAKLPDKTRKNTKPKSLKSQTNTPNFNTLNKQLNKHMLKTNPIITPMPPTLNPPLIVKLKTNTTTQQKNIIDGSKKNTPKLKKENTTYDKTPTQIRQKIKQNKHSQPKQNKYASKTLQNTQITNIIKNNKKTLNTLDQITHKIKKNNI